MKKLISTRDLYIFLLSVFLISITIGASNSFWSIYLDRLGASETLIGFSWTLAALSEIPIMLGAHFFMKRFSAEGLFKISFLAYAMHWFLLSIISNPSLAVATQLLHGLSFAAFLTAGVTIISQIAPTGMGTTAQSLFDIVAYSLGAIIGNMIGSFYYEKFGLTSMFQLLFIIALISIIFFWVSYKPGVKLKPKLGIDT